MLQKYNVSRIIVVPSLLRSMIETAEPTLRDMVPLLRCWACSGEALPWSLMRLFFEQGCTNWTLMNLYGTTTEVAGDISCATFTHDDVLALDSSESREGTSHNSNSTVVAHIGKPILNSEILILDPVTLAVMGEEQLGEIFCTGASLAWGHYQQPDQGQPRGAAGSGGSAAGEW